ncbi:MAG: hypothetical protein PGN15_13150 [Aeromicrobium erythreum]
MPRLERSVSDVFAHQYERQARLLGHDGVSTASLHVRAMCERGGPDVPDVGPGSDWICLLGWTDPDVPMPPEGYGKVEVAVHANDCYTASSPSKLVGFQTIEDRHGRTVNNPVAEFDGCFDPAGDDTPTGVTFPSVLQVTSTAMARGHDGRASVQVSCGPGKGGCTGEMDVTVDRRVVARVPYRIAEQATPTLRLTSPLPAGATTVDLSFRSSVGAVPPSPVTLPVQD